MDGVALASVLSSGLVALGGIAATVINAERQRSHERALSFEERAWETKSSALFRLIATTQAFLRLVEPGSQKLDRVALEITATTDALADLAPVIEAYGSESCRAAFGRFHRLLVRAGYDPVARFEVEHIRDQKEAAIDAEDFDEAMRLRRNERDVIDRASEAVDLDLDEAHAYGVALLEAARVDVQGR